MVVGFCFRLFLVFLVYNLYTLRPGTVLVIHCPLYISKKKKFPCMDMVYHGKLTKINIMHLENIKTKPESDRT